jgi:hypothetical protein
MKRNLTFLIGLFLIACCNSVYAQAPIFTTNFYNPCGNDGNNEFLVGRAAATTDFDPLKLYYFVSGANADGSGRDSIYQTAFCSSLTATGNGSSACNAAGWSRSTAVGSGSVRILDYTNAADQSAIDAVVARLNYRQASCASGSCSNTFIAPPASGLIPAGAKFIFFISQGVNDTAATAGTAIDFCAFCGQGPFYVVVASFPAGASGLLTNTFTATTSRYISLAYDFGGATGIAETQSYIHVPSSASLTTRNYFQLIPQGANALSNNIAANDNTLDCSIAANIALPVTLSGFRGEYRNGVTLLNWSTASEQSADRFEIEKSIDSRNFATIGSVKAQGTTSTGAMYNYTDQEPFSGRTYYRLKQFDLDGKNAYSEIIAVTAPDAGQVLTVSPNPCRDYIHIALSSLINDKATLMLINASGVLVRNTSETLQTGVNTTSLDLDNLPAGVYYLKIQTSQATHNKTIVKQ